jgi:transketolase
MDMEGLQGAALTVRALTMDAVQRAESGHPGLPMGCAELGSLLYGELLNHSPEHPDWINRDRFVLSAGHGSMFLYSLLYLCGYNVSLDDIKGFRSVGSKTPGHPEYGVTEGVETTTGPLGQGFGNAVGMAIAERMLAEKFNTADHRVIDHFTYVLAGDGDMMEGVSAEAASLAGHLGLGKLIAFYDSNKISIEGDTELAFSESVEDRFRAYGWQTFSGDAYDLKEIRRMVEEARKETRRPTLILLSSLIGKGSPNKAGTHSVHGAALGEDEVKASKRELGIPEDEDFYVDPRAPRYFSEQAERWRSAYEQWEETFSAWEKANPELKREWDRHFGAADLNAIDFPSYEEGKKEATRKISGAVMQEIAKALPHFVGGSADLAPSNNTLLKEYGDFSRRDAGGRNLHFGVREHAMGSLTNGIMLHGGLRPYAATFLVFSDYMRPAIRLAALMKLPVIFIFTHDSIYIGEDGPTHQPVEQLAGLRSIPGLTVLRPGDPEETVEAWKMALENTAGPTALVFTRQKTVQYPKADAQCRSKARRGAYIVRDSAAEPETVILATGSEVGLALQAAEQCGDSVRVVSVFDRATLEAMPQKLWRELVPEGSRVMVAEAGSGTGWGLFVHRREDLFTIERFGESGPGNEVAAHIGFTAEKLAERCQKK